jgi:predicted site-specific integrase-resolvase
MKQALDKSKVIQYWPGTNQLTKPLREVAEILNVHPNSVFRWKKNGKIEYVCLGKNSIHFTYDQVVSYINKNSARTAIRSEF